LEAGFGIGFIVLRIPRALWQVHKRERRHKGKGERIPFEDEIRVTMADATERASKETRLGQRSREYLELQSDAHLAGVA
jgi:hypothetical protein